MLLSFVKRLNIKVAERRLAGREEELARQREEEDTSVLSIDQVLMDASLPDLSLNDQIQTNQFL